MDSNILILIIFIVGVVVLIGYFFIAKFNLLNLGKNKAEKVEILNKAKKIEYSSLSVELLKLEFDYAKETSIEAQRDRLSLLNFYLGLYAAVGTITIGISEISYSGLEKYIPIIFIILGFISYIFILQIMRLRQAWISSAKVMNKIKDYFIDKDKELSDYIIWRTETLPKPQKFKTINYLSALLIATLGTIAISVGLLMLNLFWILIVLIGVLYFIVTIASYHLMLQYDI